VNWLDEITFEQPATLSRLEKSDDRFEKIEGQFLAGWQETREKKLELWEFCYDVGITAIYQVRNPLIYQRFNDYVHPSRTKVTLRLWHGTAQENKCPFGRGSQDLCLSTKCALCNIARTGFDMKYAGNNYAQRFGNGLYFGPHPSKSHDYTTPGRNERTDGKAVMLLCNVHVDRVKTYTTSQWCSGTFPLPDGYDSVLGQVSDSSVTDGVINFPERVIYNHDAAAPCYFVCYDFRKVFQ
jgi:hypothetical protein